jgi:hypothetical protein
VTSAGLQAARAAGIRAVSARRAICVEHDRLDSAGSRIHADSESYRRPLPPALAKLSFNFFMIFSTG